LQEGPRGHPAPRESLGPAKHHAKCVRIFSHQGMGLGERWVRRVTYLACRGVSPLLDKPRDKLLVLRDVGCPRLAPELRIVVRQEGKFPEAFLGKSFGWIPISTLGSSEREGEMEMEG
jgi:hypothetical protein